MHGNKQVPSPHPHVDYKVSASAHLPPIREAGVGGILVGVKHGIDQLLSRIVTMDDNFVG